ncbi:MAG: amidohydrolase [Pseudonocardiales bacterium]|nr:amidohydrolase [Pseudonocardiales bacterium]
MTTTAGIAPDLFFRDVLVYDATSPSGTIGPTDVHVRDGRIHAIGAGLAESVTHGRVISGHGHHVLIPGLINAHFHSPANHLKGSLPGLPLEVFMLYESPSSEWLKPTPRQAYLRTMLGAIEMLKAGTTSVQDDAFLMPYPEPDIIDAVMSAYADSGIRAVVALDQPEVPEVDKLPFLQDISARAGTTEFHAPAPLGMDGLLAAYDHLFSRWHGAEEGRLTAAVSISAPQRVSPEYFEALDDLSRQHHVPLFAHMLETRTQRALKVNHPRFRGRSLVEYTSDLGLLSDRMNIIHAVWVDELDLELIAAAGSVVAHNPISNLRLGSGVMPYRQMRDLGITVALGVDEAICGDAINMWGVARMMGLIHTITGASHERWPSAAEVLDSVFHGGAAAMLRSEDLGKIAVGAVADLALFDLHSIAFTPLNDLRGQMVYCESGSDVVLTVVGGRIVVEDDRVLGIDEKQLLSEMRETFAQRAPVQAQSTAESSRLRPIYDEVVDRANRTDVGMTRWVQM